MQAFEALTGCAVLVNTSFNVRGEPIAATPQQANEYFMKTEMNYRDFGFVLGGGIIGMFGIFLPWLYHSILFVYPSFLRLF